MGAIGAGMGWSGLGWVAVAVAEVGGLLRTEEGRLDDVGFAVGLLDTSARTWSGLYTYV